MSWRAVQLGSTTCDQDRKLLQLINNRSVRIYGDHQGFDQFCSLDPHSDFCVIFLNTPAWLSEIRDSLYKYLELPTNCVYVGVNRYQIKGNDIGNFPINHSDNHSQQILTWTQQTLHKLGFQTLQQGYMDKDLGRYFNFVQPLTWIYAERATNQSY
jgi:hypothetical protein